MTIIKPSRAGVAIIAASLIASLTSWPLVDAGAVTRTTRKSATPTTKKASKAAPPTAAPTTAAPTSAAPTTSAAAPSKSKKLVVGQAAPLIGNFNPYNLTFGNNVAMYQVYDPLVRVIDGKPEARLAEKWDLSFDGLTLTIKMRKATFADGTPITSQHVAVSLAYVQDAKNGANALTLAQRVRTIETPTDDTVIMKFAAPFPAVLDLLNLLLIVDKGTIDSQFAKPNASGPFTVKSYDADTGYTLVPNTRFWRGAPAIPSIEVKFLSETTLTGALKAGDIDMISIASIPDYESLKKDKKYISGLSGGANSVIALTLNVTAPALSNPDVRLALSRAINRKRIVEDVMLNAATAACLPFNDPTQLGYDAYLASQCTYDLKDAQFYLKRAGVESLSFSVVTSAQINTAMPKIAEIIQNDLASIGVRVRIDEVDAAAFRAQAPGTFPQGLLQVYGRANLDPDTLFSATNAWRGTNNASRYNDPLYTRLVTQAGSTVDTNTRKALYKQIAELSLKQNFVIPIVTNPKPWIAIAGLKGLGDAANGQPLFEDATVS